MMSWRRHHARQKHAPVSLTDEHLLITQPVSVYLDDVLSDVVSTQLFSCQLCWVCVQTVSVLFLDHEETLWFH